MKRFGYAMLILLCAARCSAEPMPSQTNDEAADDSAPPGMTRMKVGDANVIMPKDGVVRKEGDLLVVEGPSEYAARKFQALESRLAGIDAALKALNRDVEELKRKVGTRDNRPVYDSGS